MKNWRKGLIAATAVFLSIGGIWAYDQFQRYQDGLIFTQDRPEETKLNACKQIVGRAIPGTHEVIGALACSSRFSQLSWFEKARQSRKQLEEQSKKIEAVKEHTETIG